MKITVLPSSAIARSVVNRTSASCGVSTAVGSSRMRMFASRYSAFTISTRCCSPSESCQTFARGSTSMP